jgi:hypothetical protein
MSLANSNGPRWIRAQHVAAEKRREGLGPVRAFLATLFGRTPPTASARPPAPAPTPADREREVIGN